MHIPSLLDCTFPSKLSRRSQSHSMAYSQPAQLYAPNHAFKTLSIAFNDILAACLTVRSQVRAQDPPNHTRWHTPSLLDCMLPSKLSRLSQAHSRARFQVHSQFHSMTLTTYLALCSQIHSQEARHSQSLLTICSHVCSCVLDPETC